MQGINTEMQEGSLLPGVPGTAASQERQILLYAISNPGLRFSPERIWQLMFGGSGVPLTSVRRAITNLASYGHLYKTGHKEPGLLGRAVHTWKAAPVRR